MLLCRWFSGLARKALEFDNYNIRLRRWRGLDFALEKHKRYVVNGLVDTINAYDCTISYIWKCHFGSERLQCQALWPRTSSS